jgi:hypothetical protein
MMSQSPTPLSRLVFDTQALVNRYPPHITNPNKRIVYDIACPAGSTHSGQITVSRWGRMELPAVLDLEGKQTTFEGRPGFFGYEPLPPGEPVVEWYLNFADRDLFFGYGGRLFAQDEMQVAEHPALPSLRERLFQSEIPPLTEENGQPTPVLVMGVERRCSVATNPDTALGRPHGLYGNHFSAASPEAIKKATRPILPPTITNLLAMAAPAGGYGRYTRQKIETILATAFTGFSAACLESCREKDPLPRVVVHTGFWGCGAYGGHRVLMALLQLLAARLARLDHLVFHIGDAPGAGSYSEAVRILERVLLPGNRPLEVSQLIDRIESMGFEWGTSDGN